MQRVRLSEEHRSARVVESGNGALQWRCLLTPALGRMDGWMDGWTEGIPWRSTAGIVVADGSAFDVWRAMHSEWGSESLALLRHLCERIGSEIGSIASARRTALIKQVWSHPFDCTLQTLALRRRARGQVVLLCRGPLHAVRCTSLRSLFLCAFVSPAVHGRSRAHGVCIPRCGPLHCTYTMCSVL